MVDCKVGEVVAIEPTMRSIASVRTDRGPASAAILPGAIAAAPLVL
jgi:hypothetical protein